MKTEQRKCCCGGLPALWWWLLALLGAGLLYLGMIANKQKPIEQDLTQRSSAKLTELGYNWVKPVVDQHGRDVYLSGIAPDEASRKTAIQNVQSLYGVRTVDAAGLKVAGDPVINPLPVTNTTTTTPTDTLAVGTASGLIAAGTTPDSTTTSPDVATTTVTNSTSLPANTATTSVENTSSTPDATATTVATSTTPATSTTESSTTLGTPDANTTSTELGNVNSSTPAQTTTTATSSNTSTTPAESQAATTTPAETVATSTPAPEATTPSANTTTTPAETVATTTPNSNTTTETVAAATPSAEPVSPNTNTAQALTPTTNGTDTTAATKPPVVPEPEPAVVLDDKQQVCQNRFSQEMGNKTIQFSVNKAVINPRSYPLLDTLATIAQECANALGNLKVEIGGHTDSDGNDNYNQVLSEQRADAVKQYLVKKGVNTMLLTVRGYGEARPVASNLTAEGRAQNRRIEFKLK